MWWSTTALPIFRSSAPGRELTDQIVEDRRFKPGVIAQVLERMESEPKRIVPQGAFARALALINVRTAEEAAQRKSAGEVDREAARAEDKVRASLTINPADSFLWLILYSLDTGHNGFDGKQTSYLDQSYKTGPREGWIALRRNRIALALFSLLGEPGQEEVVAEFAGLVESEFIDDAALNLLGVGWAHRERLVSSLQRADVTGREALAKRLSQEGIKVAIPGIQNDERPWR
ncbi:hypothetical protein [Bradyrhizobium sp. 151]|uniref:hypothetical protein n=1 Tax=Bradyrhizobium sp. 151 TaxID=2782626 RepID=UPI001FFAD045|nr:hypothetical protein [Bradyrhizobium sp. 151]MCK1663450.1 hypothetical protein [Bradyrhizobium sp. 151]